MTNPPVGVPTCYRHPDRESWIRCQRCERSICPDCMSDAAVGFQCPECVAEGRKSVRQAKTAYGGRIQQWPGRVTTVLLVIIAVVWIAVTATGGANSVITEWFKMAGDGWCGLTGRPGYLYPTVGSEQVCSAIPDGQWWPGVVDGAVWRLFSHIFTHVAVWHVALNLLALWQLGPQLERVFGSARFLALYLLAGLGGGIAILWLGAEAVGASGAWFGLLAATMVVANKVGGDLSAFRSTVVLGVVISVIPGVSWQGHLGGFVVGGLAAAVLVYAPKERRTLMQAAGLGAIAAALVAATVLRIVIAA